MRQLMHSFQDLRAPQPVLDALRDGQIAAFCLFRYNVDSLDQLYELTRSLRGAAESGGHLPPLIGIDQEGGQLIAVAHGATELPGNMALGATRSPDLAAQAGEVTARELLALGLNLNFAPSVDVNSNPANPGIGTRSFGDDPQLVGEMGAAFIHGMQRAGVLATAKHFPGSGDSSVDSHFELPVLKHDWERLNRVELPPFQAAMREGVAALMIAHAVVPELDAHNAASVSPAVMRFVREEMQFDGVVMTDAMDMAAVARLGHQASVQATLRAGIDLALLGHIPGQIDMMTSLKIPENAQSIRRIQALQARIPRELPPPDVVGSAAHQHIAQEIADCSITVVRSGHNFPLRPSADAQILLITVQPENLTPADTSSSVDIALAAAIRERHANVQEIRMQRGEKDGVLLDILNAADSAEYVVVGTITAERDLAQIALVSALHERGKAPIVVALRTPYDLTAFPMIDTYLCAYSIRPVSMEAVARVLFGEIEPRGVLPCTLPDMSVR